MDLPETRLTRRGSESVAHRTGFAIAGDCRMQGRGGGGGGGKEELAAGKKKDRPRSRPVFRLRPGYAGIDTSIYLSCLELLGTGNHVVLIKRKRGKKKRDKEKARVTGTQRRHNAQASRKEIR